VSRSASLTWRDSICVAFTSLAMVNAASARRRARARGRAMPVVGSDLIVGLSDSRRLAFFSALSHNLYSQWHHGKISHSPFLSHLDPLVLSHTLRALQSQPPIKNSENTHLFR
jgi:hypothetical protein